MERSEKEYIEEGEEEVEEEAELPPRWQRKGRESRAVGPARRGWRGV